MAAHFDGSILARILGQLLLLSWGAGRVDILISLCSCCNPIVQAPVPAYQAPPAPPEPVYVHIPCGDYAARRSFGRRGGKEIQIRMRNRRSFGRKGEGKKEKKKKGKKKKKMGKKDKVKKEKGKKEKGKREKEKGKKEKEKRIRMRTKRRTQEKPYNIKKNQRRRQKQKENIIVIVYSNIHIL